MRSESIKGLPEGIGRTLAVQIFIVVSVAVLGAITFTVYINWNLSRDRLLDEAVSRLEGYHIVLTRQMHNLDHEGVQQISKLIANDTDIVAFRVVNRFNKIIAEHGDPEGAKQRTHHVTRRVEDRFDSSFTEAIAIYYVLPPSFGRDAMSRIMMFSAIAVSVCLLMAVEVYRRISRNIVAPLRKLHDAVESRDPGDWVGPGVDGPLEVVELEREIGNAFHRAESANDRVMRHMAALTNVLGNYGLAIRYLDKDGLVSDFGSVAQSRVAAALPDSNPGDTALLLEDMRRESQTIEGRVSEIDVKNSSFKKALLQLDFEHENGSVDKVTLFDLDHNDYAIVIADITRARQLEVQTLNRQKVETLGRLSSGIAHDFNNILNIVVGNAELLEYGVNISRETITPILSACERGAKLTQSLLSFARRSQLEIRHVDMNKIVSNLMTWSRGVLPENISTDVVLDSGIWTVKVDPAMAENALLNLLLNARDAMPGGGKLTIETSNCRVDEYYIASRQEPVAPGRYVMLAISDTGHGIAKEDIDRIFDPFFTTKKPGEGSGVGLSMVFGFMQQSGGAVRVYSEPEVGTSFKLLFPVSTSSQMSEIVPSEEISVSQKARILLVEDELDLRNALQLHLENIGHKVTVAADGEEALAVYQQMQDFDVLVTDIVMPGSINGLKLSQQMRSKLPDLGVVLISGYARDATVYGGGTEDDVRLSKPVTRVDLIRAIETAMSRK